MESLCCDELGDDDLCLEKRGAKLADSKSIFLFFWGMGLHITCLLWDSFSLLDLEPSPNEESIKMN